MSIFTRPPLPPRTEPRPAPEHTSSTGEPVAPREGPAAAPAAATLVRPRRQLSVLAVLFLAPLVFAFLLYYTGVWRPLGHTNHGALINPARPLPEAILRPIAGKVQPSPLRGRWSIVYVGPGECSARCAETLFFQRQTYLGLDELTPRVQRVWLVTEGAPGAVLSQHPGLVVLDASGDKAQELRAAFPADAREQTLFIVDPLGNLMMRYDATASPRGLHDDMRKLLTLSHIG